MIEEHRKIIDLDGSNIDTSSCANVQPSTESHCKSSLACVRTTEVTRFERGFVPGHPKQRMCERDERSWVAKIDARSKKQSVTVESRVISGTTQAVKEFDICPGSTEVGYQANITMDVGNDFALHAAIWHAALGREIHSSGGSVW